MKIKNTRVYKQFVLEVMIMMEEAKKIETQLNHRGVKTIDTDRVAELTVKCNELGLKLDGDIYDDHYINAMYGVVYDLRPTVAAFRDPCSLKGLDIDHDGVLKGSDAYAIQ